MNEVKIYSGLLLVLLVGAYLTWTRDESAPKDDEKVTLLDIEREAIEALRLVSETATVAVRFEKDPRGGRYAWFEVEGKSRSRKFTANAEFEKRLEAFAPFVALRSLGKLTEKELEAVELARPKRKLTVTHSGKSKVFELGGRTSGARDHYVRVAGGEDVHLVASRVIGDFEFPDGQFMQRKLREKDVDAVEKVILSVGGRQRAILQQNRLVRQDAYWASEEVPDERNETLGNYVDKLDRLTAVEYLTDPALFEKAAPILEVEWIGEGGKSEGTLQLRRAGEGASTKYYAVATVTRVPVEVSKFTAEQLEQDLESVLSPDAPAKAEKKAPPPKPEVKPAGAPKATRPKTAPAPPTKPKIGAPSPSPAPKK